jgi:hypothetical protein
VNRLAARALHPVLVPVHVRWLSLVLALACNRTPGAHPPDEGQLLLELRDPQGQPTFSLQRTATGFRYLDSESGAGQITAAPGGRFRTDDPRRGPLEAWRLEGGGVEIRGREGMVMRLTREGASWRLGDAAGIPLARVRLDGASGEAVGHDPGGLVVVRVKAGGGRLVVSDRDGNLRGLFTGQLDQLSLTRAALAALPALGGVERALLLIAAGA